jgi:hypothetical protein
MEIRTGDDYVYAQPHQPGCKFRQPLHPASGVPLLENKIASLDVTEIAQTFLERVEKRRNGLLCRTQEKADSIDLCNRLSLSDRLRDDKAARESANETPSIHCWTGHCRRKTARYYTVNAAQGIRTSPSSVLAD